MATHDDDIVNEMRKRVVELKDGVVIRDEARASTLQPGDRGACRRQRPGPADRPLTDPRRRTAGSRMRLQFILGEIGTGLRRNLSMAVSVILVTLVSMYLLGAAACCPAPGRHR